MTDAITLTNAERMELTRRANSRADRAEDARRARLILLLAEGHTWDEASERIECSRGFVASWSKRFAEQRIAGLLQPALGPSRLGAHAGAGSADPGGDAPAPRVARRTGARASSELTWVSAT